MLGDTAVAVHPDDPRYQDLVGKTVMLPLLDREIPIIADATLVDLEFGTGVVKVTPAHDFNDYQTGLRHKLPMISILDEAARTNEAAGPYAGLDRFEAREARARGSRGARAAGVGEAAHAQHRALPAERDHRRAAAVPAVVRAHRAAGQAGHRGGGAGPDPHRPRDAGEATYFHWMRNIQRLVRQPPAVVGPPDPRVVLRRLHAAHAVRRARPREGRRPSSRGPSPRPVRRAAARR